MAYTMAFSPTTATSSGITSFLASIVVTFTGGTAATTPLRITFPSDISGLIDNTGFRFDESYITTSPFNGYARWVGPAEIELSPPSGASNPLTIGIRIYPRVKSGVVPRAGSNTITAVLYSTQLIGPLWYPSTQLTSAALTVTMSSVYTMTRYTIDHTLSASTIYSDEAVTATFTLTKTGDTPRSPNHSPCILLQAPIDFTIASVSYSASLALKVAPSNTPVAFPVYSNAQVLAQLFDLPSDGDTITVTLRPKRVGAFRTYIELTGVGLGDSSVSGTSIARQLVVLEAPPDAAVPTAPSGVTCTPYVDDRQYTHMLVSWTDNSSNERTQEVFRASGSSGAYSKIATLAKDVTSFIDDGLSPGTTYSYHIDAINTRGRVRSAVAGSGATSAAPAAPSAPSGVVASDITSKTCRLTWTDNSSTERGFKVYKGTASGGPYTEAMTLPAGATSAFVEKLEPGTANYLIVAAFNYGGEGRSAEVTVLTSVEETTIGTVSGFTNDPRSASKTSMLQIAGKVLICSPYDRMLVYANRKWFRGGLKHHRTAPVISNSGSVGLTGTYKAYTVLFDSNRQVRSIPSDASLSSGALTNKQLTIIPEGNRAFLVSAATNATPIAVTTTAAHGLATGAQVYIENVGGNTAANGVWTVTVTSSTAFTLDTSVGNGAYTSGGTVSTKIKCRDKAYDASGNQIDAADFCEIYVHEINSMDRPVCVATIPLTTLKYTTPTSLTLTALQDGTRRPMETLLESTIPPACGLVEYFNNRVHLSGEITIKPSQNQATVATMTLTNGSRTVTCANYKFTDALYHKEIFRNKAPTGWFVSDVISDTQLEIRHPDPAKNTLGYEGSTATIYDFAFAARPKMYRSAYFSGEAQGGITFSPETFPPLNVLEGELEPDDDDEIAGMITSKDVLFVFKRNKAMYLRGGEGTDESAQAFPTVTTISRGSGLLASRSLCRDRYDTIYGLNEQGPFACTTAGMKKIGTMAGAAFLFQRFFDITTAKEAVGEWFPREDYYVVTGLTRSNGTSSGLDGFTYDSRTGWILPFTNQQRVTSLRNCPTDSGDYQLLIGDTSGQSGVFLQRDIYTDNVDYTSSTPYANETGYTCYATSGTLANAESTTIKGFRPHINQDPLTTPVTVTVAIDTKKRSDNTASAFSADVSREFTTGTGPTVRRITPKRGQRMKVKVSFPSSRSERVEWQGIELEGMTHGVGAG